VSSGVPYVAPWQSGFERHPVQNLTPAASGAAKLSLPVPEGQWWRLIYANGRFTTSALPNNRGVFLSIVGADGVEVLRAFAAAAQTPGNTYTYLYGPHVTTFAVVAGTATQMIAEAIPDLLWPPNSVIALDVNQPLAGDAWEASPRTFSVEVYTPVRETSELLVPTPVFV
jgi:hypothetical protein